MQCASPGWPPKMRKSLSSTQGCARFQGLFDTASLKASARLPVRRTMTNKTHKHDKGAAQ
eukprot:5138861-Amphidinium_carterae.1